MIYIKIEDGTATVMVKGSTIKALGESMLVIRGLADGLSRIHMRSAFLKAARQAIEDPESIINTKDINMPAAAKRTREIISDAIQASLDGMSKDEKLEMMEEILDRMRENGDDSNE